MSDMLRRRYSRRSVLKSTGAAALGGSAAILVGCGGDDDAGGTATGTSGSGGSGGGAGTATATATQAATPRSGGTFRFRDEYGGNGDPVTLAPFTGTGGARTSETQGYANPALYVWDHRPGGGGPVYGVPRPNFVSEPEQPDGLTYIFKIPENAVWENKAPADGRRVTTEDVVWSLDMALETSPSTAAKFSPMESYEAIDETTLEIKMNRPWGAFLSQFSFKVFNPEFVESGASEEDTLGCGMYRLVSLERGNQMVHERNPDYWKEGLPYIDRLERVIIVDESAAEASYRSGNLQGMSVSRKDIADSLVDAQPGSHVHSAANHSNYWFGMDCRNPMFQDIRVRQALSMALDRDALLRIYGGGGVWGTQVGALAFATEDPRTEAFGPNRKYYEYNLEEAKALMSAAGVDSLGTMDLFMTQFLRGPSAVQEAELVAAWLTEHFGANLTIKELQFAEAYEQLITTPQWEGIAICQTRSGPDPEDYLPTFWHPDSGRYLAPGIDDLIKAENPVGDLIDKHGVELDFDQRMEYSKEIVKILSEHMYNIPFVLPDRYFVVSPEVNVDWMFSTSGGSIFIEDAWIADA